MPPAFPGLCADCAFSRIVDSGRSVFYLCQRALTDPRFPKYPPLPVLSCPGYERQSSPPAGGTAGDDKLSP
jgi:hypothetical protein